MIDATDVGKMLNKAFDLQVYEGNAPDSAGLPCLTFFHVTASTGRDANDSLIANGETYRLSIVANDAFERKELIEVITKTLDGSRDHGFSKIYCTLVSRESPILGVRASRAFLQLEVQE